MNHRCHIQTVCFYHVLWSNTLLNQEAYLMMGLQATRPQRLVTLACPQEALCLPALLMLLRSYSVKASAAAKTIVLMLPPPVVLKVWSAC